MRQRCGIMVVVIGWLLGCGHPVEICTPLPAPVTGPQGPMLDDEPQDEAPSFQRLHDKVFEPQWL